MASKKNQGYIRWNNEGIVSFEIESVQYNVSRMGFKNIALMCETLMFNEKEVKKIINSAIKDGYKCCDYGAWTFYWKNLDDFRDWMKSKNVPIEEIRLRNAHGRLPMNLSDYTPSNLKFGELLFKFMNK